MTTAAVLESAERSVIGAVLYQNACLPRVHLLPWDFYDRQCSRAWEAILELQKAGSAIDPLLVEHQLNGRGWSDSLVFLSGCLSSTLTADNVEFYADIVIQQSRARKLEALGSILGNKELEADERLARAKTIIGELEAPVAGSTSPVAPHTAAEVLRSATFAAPQLTYSTGFPMLDRLLDGGLKARTLSVIAAPTGAGKTGLALTIARALDMPVLYVTAELDNAEISARYAAPVLGVRPSEILALAVRPDRAAAAVDQRPLHIVDLDGIGGDPAISRIRDAAEGIRLASGNAPAIVVDYLQLLAADTGDSGAMRMSITRVTLELRRLARALNVPVLAISSVSRAYYGTQRAAMDAEEDPRAWLAAAKEDGNIEYTAAIFAYLDTSTEIASDGTSAARVIVAKSRAGIPGIVGLRFHGPSGGFTAADASTASFGPARRTQDLEAKIVAAIAAANRAPTLKDLRAMVTGYRKDSVQECAEQMVGAKVPRLGTKTEIRMTITGKRHAVSVLTLPTPAHAEDGD